VDHIAEKQRNKTMSSQNVVDEYTPKKIKNKKASNRKKIEKPIG